MSPCVVLGTVNTGMRKKEKENWHWEVLCLCGVCTDSRDVSQWNNDKIKESVQVKSVKRKRQTSKRGTKICNPKICHFGTLIISS